MKHPFSLTLALIMLISLSCMSQQRQFKISEVESLFKATENEVYKTLAKKEYSYTGKDGSIVQYKKNTSLGFLYLNIIFGKNGHLKAFAWSEHIIFSNHINAEISSSGYVDEKAIISNGLKNETVSNANKGMRILVTTIAYQNLVNLNMQLMPKEIADPNRPKAVFSGGKVN